MTADWQPIESAPRDGTQVDLWVVDIYLRPSERHHRVNSGERITNAQWKNGARYLPDHPDKFDGWCYREGMYTHQIEMLLSGGERYATHWMPLPEPPTGADS